MSAIPIPSLLVRTATAVTRPVRTRLPVAQIEGADARLRSAEGVCHRWLIAHSIAILRVTVGMVFLAFGVLKFFPGVSPAQNLVVHTTDMLTLGLIPGAVALVLVASLETVIGLCLITGRGMRGATYLLVVPLVGILSPLVLLTGRLFDGPHGAPTLEGQYVFKDIILVGAALVLAATLGGAKLAKSDEAAADQH